MDGNNSAPVIRPWGRFTVLDESEVYKVKRIEVLSGKRLSYQKHASRSEHWTVVQGTARVTLNGRQSDLNVGESLDIPATAAHRVENPEAGPLVLIEVQHGRYLEEDDIERLEDDFGRV
jgi:mannose-6-phosphate isomerase-like protein (cupin superfamily)